MGRVCPGLLFTAGTTNVVNVGSATALDNVAIGAGTILIWLLPTTINTATTWFAKSGTSFLFNQTATTFQISIARATQSLNASSTFANNATYGAGKRCVVGVTWDTAGANGDQQTWHGDLNTPIRESAAYSPQRVGSGAVTDSTASNLLLGNRDAGNGALDGTVFAVGVWDYRLSLYQLKEASDELKSGVAGPWARGAKVCAFPGQQGTSVVLDQSGNGNHGTITGAVPNGVGLGISGSVADANPIMLPSRIRIGA